VHSRRNAEAAKHGALIWFVGDAESFRQSNPISELTQKLGAKRVDGSTLYALHSHAELAIQSGCDLAGCLVCECEDADTAGIESTLLDQKPDSLDEAVGFSSARPSADQKWLRVGFDSSAL
jgi:hypothetical protein